MRDPAEIKKNIEDAQRCVRYLKRELNLALHPEALEIMAEAERKAKMEGLTMHAVGRIYKIAGPNMSNLLNGLIPPSKLMMRRLKDFLQDKKKKEHLKWIDFCWYCDNCIKTGKLIGTKNCSSCRSLKWSFYNKKYKYGVEGLNAKERNRIRVDALRKKYYAAREAMNPEKVKAIRERHINQYYKQMYGEDFAEAGKALNRLRKILRSADK